MAILQLALIGAAGFGLYKYANRNKTQSPAAFDADEGSTGGSNQVRNAGPEAMRDKPTNWDSADQASDASFPASDPPANY